MALKRPGRWALRSKRWPALRMQALRRDGFRCVLCGARGRLEVDHILPVQAAPELAFDLGNLQSLCGGCHSRKTHREVFGEPDPERAKWWALLRELYSTK